MRVENAVPEVPPQKSPKQRLEDLDEEIKKAEDGIPRIKDKIEALEKKGYRSLEEDRDLKEAQRKLEQLEEKLGSTRLRRTEHVHRYPELDPSDNDSA